MSQVKEQKIVSFTVSKNPILTVRTEIQKNSKLDFQVHTVEPKSPPFETSLLFIQMSLSVLAIILSFIALLKIFKYGLVMVTTLEREGISSRFVILLILLVVFLAMLYYGVDNLWESLKGVSSG